MLKKKIFIIVIIPIILVVMFIVFDVPKILYPIKYEDIVIKYSNEFNIDKYLIYAIIKAESNFNEKAQSSKGAKGLMQIIDKTAKDILKKMDENQINEEDIENKLLEPEFNIKLGTKYISLLKEKYQNLELALVAYNAGSGNVDNWIDKGILNKDGSNIEKVPYKETNNYVRKILNYYEIYKAIYEK